MFIRWTYPDHFLPFLLIVGDANYRLLGPPLPACVHLTAPGAHFSLAGTVVETPLYSWW